MRTQILQSLFLIFCLPFFVVAQDCFEEILPNGGDCNSAVFLCGNLFDGYTGTLPSTPTDTSVGSHPDVLCVGGDVDNYQWYSFIPCESTIELNIIPASCTPTQFNLFGLQTGVYEDCTFGNPMFCYAEQGVDPINIVLNDMIPGNIYYLFVDGYAGSICDYTFEVVSGIDTSEPEQPDDVNVDISASSVSICEGDQIKVSFDVPDLNIGGFSCGDITGADLGYVACFEWTVAGTPTNSAINLDDAYDIVSGGSTACAQIVFYSEGTYQITTNAEFNPAVFGGLGSCTVADVIFNTITIVVESQVLQVEQEIVLCQGQEYEYCDSTYTETTVVQCEVGCTTFLQSLVFNPSSITDLGNFFICASDCFEFQGVDYCSAGFYEVEDANDCSVRFSFSISILIDNIEYSGESEIDCNVESIILNPIYIINNNESLNFEWTDASNTVLGNAATLEITTAGSYTVALTSSDIETGCIINHTIEITEDNTSPILTIDPPIITCDDPMGTIVVTSDLDVQSVSWSGPDSFTSDDISPIVSQVGMYTVTITGTNGCISEENVDVNGDLLEPSITLDYRDIDCNVLVVEATYISDVATRSQLWSGPGISSDAPVIMIDQAGTYTLTVIGFNGCQTTETFTINDIKDWPIVDAGQDILWNCNTQILELSAIAPTGSEFLYEWILISGDPFTNISDDRIEANSIGEYEIIVTNTILGCVSRDTVAITENMDIPTAFVGELADPMCYDTDNGFMMVESIIGGAAPYIITIDDNEIMLTEVLNDLSDGTYDLSITDNNGCNYTEELILIKPLEIILDAPSEIDIKYYANESFVLEHSVNDDDIAEINWYNALGEFIGQGESIDFDEKQSTIITVELITNDGCSVSQEIELRVDSSIDIYVPNIFSPNGDGSNDIFWVEGEDNGAMIESLLIYDRWGSLVYEAKEMAVGESSRGWDGKLNGQDVLSGVYVYLLEVRTATDEKFFKSGDITIIR